MFTGTFIADALSLSLPLTGSATRICSDTRHIRPGDLFVAIVGTHFDGHHYVEAAIEKGAVGVIVKKGQIQKPTTVRDFTWWIEVEDPILALRKIASAHRKRLKGKVIAVAGSNGKTTTKEWLSFLLEAYVGTSRVFKSKKSENSILGIALSLLQVKEEDFVILEIGIDEPGWMEEHLQIVQPHFGILTSIAEEHLARLKNIETVAQEEMKLYHFLFNNNGQCVINIDSEWIDRLKNINFGTTYSLKKSADSEGLFKSPQTLHAFGSEFINPKPGSHNAENLLGALTLLTHLTPQITKEDFEDLAKKCVDFRGEDHRSLWYRLPDRDLMIFDDCYNANPDSMKCALQTFEEMTEPKDRLLAVGAMADLGEASLQAHIELLKNLSTKNVKRVFLYGEFFKPALEIIKLPSTITFYDNYETLEKAVIDEAKHAALFIKGSRSMKLERLIEGLKK